MQIHLDATNQEVMDRTIHHIERNFCELYTSVDELSPSGFSPLAASGAISPHVSASYLITKAGVAALTIAAPIAGADDGVTLDITSSTAYAHTITATGLLQTGTASVNLATLAAYAGARLTLTAYQGKWYIQDPNGITFS
jgi:hypothetical protein